MDSFFLTIGQVAKAAGVHRNTVVAYENKGIVQSQRVGTNRQRVFTRDAVDAICAHRKAQAKGNGR